MEYYLGLCCLQSLNIKYGKIQGKKKILIDWRKYNINTQYLKQIEQIECSNNISKNLCFKLLFEILLNVFEINPYGEFNAQRCNFHYIYQSKDLTFKKDIHINGYSNMACNLDIDSDKTLELKNHLKDFYNLYRELKEISGIEIQYISFDKQRCERLYKFICDNLTIKNDLHNLLEERVD